MKKLIFIVLLLAGGYPLKTVAAQSRVKVNIGVQSQWDPDGYDHVEVNDRHPYKNAQLYRTKYAAYKENREQRIIRNSRDSRYFSNKEHSRYNQ